MSSLETRKAVVRICEPTKDANATKVNRRRPASVYDNLDSSISSPNGSPAATSSPLLQNNNNNNNINTDNNKLRQPSNDSSPLVATMTATTVPINMAKQKGIGERHQPTRSSLRHSRMIVLSKHAKVPRKYLPPVLRKHRLAKSLLALQLLMGIAICTVAGWLFVWAPNLPLCDRPYWSGLPVLFSSLIGLILVFACRKEHPGMQCNCCVFSFKIISILASLVAATASFSATIFAALHLFRLYTSTCQPEHVLTAPCICNTTTDIKSYFEYQDLNCPEVINVLTVLLVGGASANFIAGFLSSWYIYLHWSARYTRQYAQVRTSDKWPIVITNKM